MPVCKLASIWQTVHYLARPMDVLKFPPLTLVARACTDEFLAMVTEGVVHSVCKVVTRLSFGAIRQHKASGGIWAYLHCDTRSHTDLEQ